MKPKFSRETIGGVPKREENKIKMRQKYARAVTLYATTDLAMREIAKVCEVSAGGLRAYLRRYHRDLVLARYGVKLEEGVAPEQVLLRSQRGQTPFTKEKYKAAVEACASSTYMRYNISQIAREFHVDGTGLANQLRLHYPEVLELREQERASLGIVDNKRRGLRPDCREMYAEAVEMYDTSGKSLPQVAEACGVSLGGLSQHLRFYHKELLERKAEERKIAQQSSQNGRKRGR